MIHRTAERSADKRVFLSEITAVQLKPIANEGQNRSSFTGYPHAIPDSVGLCCRLCYHGIGGMALLCAVSHSVPHTDKG